MNRKAITTIVLVVLGVVLVGLVAAALQPGGPWMGPRGAAFEYGPFGYSRFGHGPFGYGPGFGAGFALFGLLRIALLVAGVVLIVRAFRGGSWRGNDAEQILRRRLAAGEITQEQYDEIRRVLQVG